MSRIESPVDNGFYELDSLPLAAQSCINLYPVTPEAKGALATGALFRTPGLELVDTLSSGAGRGFHKFSKTNTLYSVNGTVLYKKTALGTNAALGTIEGTGRVSMSSNAVTLCIIVPGGKGYFYDAVNGLVEITDSIFTAFKTQQGGVTSVCLKDNRFVYTTDEEFFLGSPFTTNNGQNFDALDYEDAEVSSDPIVRAMNIKNELYIMGSETIELYQSVGGTSFPYTRILGATIEKGIKSRFGVIAFDNSFVFLGGSVSEKPAIWKGMSAAATKISTSAVDTAIQRYTDAELSTVTSWTYSENGGFFVGFNFPNETFVYDAAASAHQQRPVWHERKTGSSRWSVDDIVTIFGENIANHYNGTSIGTLSRSHLDEYGTAIERTFSGSYFTLGGDDFAVSTIELKTNAGVGNAKGTAGDEPTIEMFKSINGAATFTSVGSKHMGRAGQYNIRQIWRRMGRIPYSVIFKFTTYAPTALDFYRIDININDGKNKVLE
jgi:hypothetical protein